MAKEIKKTTKSDQNEPIEMTQKELDKFSLDLAKKITQLNNKQKKSKGLFGRINPLVLLVLGIGFMFLFAGIFSSVGSDKKISIGEVIQGLQNNDFSQLLIQDDGQVVAREKSFYVTSDEIDQDLPANVKETSIDDGSVEKVSLEDFVTEIKPVSIIDRIRKAFNNDSGSISEIVVGENFILGIRSGEGDDLLVSDTNYDEFLNEARDQNLDRSNLGVSVYKLAIFSKDLESSSIVERATNEEISNIIELDGITIARAYPETVDQIAIDWVPNYATFAEVLQNSGINLDSNNFEIVSVNVPAGISFDDVLTVLTIAGFVVLAFVIFRSAQASGMGIMQFGQSKAKMFFGQKPDVTFKDVAGIDEAREELNEIVDFLRNPSKYRKLGARIPKGVLMVGAPGTGKTLLARAIAGEAGVPFFHTSGSEFEEMLVGAGASRVRDLFAKAKKAAPSLIFIDEIDAVARKRGTRIQSGTTEQTLNQILVEMDGFEKNTNLIVLAATNRPDVLDEAILRPGRFDRQVRIELPDKDGRLDILKIHGKNKPFAKDVDLEKIAKRTVGFTGADLENILNEAAIIAAKEGKTEISTHDIEEAVSKVMLGPAKRSKKRTEKELQLVAYHEAGHALVAKHTENSIPVDKISIVSRGGTGGVTMFLPEKDENIISKGRLMADITVSLGGRAAEEIALDDISTGASNDIMQATKLARRMVQKFGMSEKLGLIQYGDFADSEFLGYGYDSSKDFSEKTAEIIDEEIRKIISQAYVKAKNIVQTHRKSLDKIATALLEKEVLDKEEFEKLFEEK